MTTSALTAKQRIDRWRGFMLSRETQDRFRSMLPQAIGAGRFYEVVLTQMRRVPALAEATPESLLGAMAASASMGLMPDGRQGVIVPFRNGRSGRQEAVWIPMYQGLVQLMYRSGMVASVQAGIVWREDAFRWEGAHDWPVHLPHFLRDPVPVPGPDTRAPWSQDGELSSMRCVWAGISTTTGGVHVEAMSPAQVEAIRKRSRSANRSDSPWNHPDDWIWMARKTALRVVTKMAPQSYELARALDLDDQAESGRSQDLESPIRVDATVIDEVAPAGPVGGSESGRTPQDPSGADRGLTEAEKGMEADWRAGLEQADSPGVVEAIAADIAKRAVPGVARDLEPLIVAARSRAG